MVAGPVPVQENLIDSRTNKVSRVWEKFFNLLRDYAITIEEKAIVGPLSGFRSGLNVTVKSTTELYVSGGSIEIGGVQCNLAVQVTLTLGTIQSDTMYFIYVNAPVSGVVLTESKFTVSVTPPVFSDSLGALYKTGDTAKRYIARYWEE